MTILHSRNRLIVTFSALALLLAACGGGADDADPASLPVNDNPDDTPAVAGACLPDEPDCVDTGVIGGEPLPLPNHDEPGTGGAGALVDGGLSVGEALTTDATGIIAVQGFLFDDGNGARLCEALAESFPPQCGGASIPITGYEEVIDVPLVSNQNVTWTDLPITVFGEIIDETLVVDPTVAG